MAQPQSFGDVISVLGPNVGFPGQWSRTADSLIVAKTALATANAIPFGAGVVLIPSATGGSFESLADFLAVATNAQNLEAYFAGVAIRNVKTMAPYSSYAQTGSTTYSTTATQGTAGSSTVVVASATGIAVGQSVEGYGIQANTLVTGVSSTTITISRPTLVAMSSSNITFTATNSPLVGSFAAGTKAEAIVRSSVTVQVNGTGTPQAGNPVYIRTVANANTAGTSLGDFEAADEIATSSITIGTTLGSTTIGTSGDTALAVGQMIVSPYLPRNTFVVSGGSGTYVVSQAALSTVASAGVATFHNTVALGAATDPWIVFSTGQIDGNNIAEIMIKNRHAA